MLSVSANFNFLALQTDRLFSRFKKKTKMNSDYLSERLSHLAQEVLGELDSLIQGKIQTAVTDVLLNPARKFSTFVYTSITL